LVGASGCADSPAPGGSADSSAGGGAAAASPLQGVHLQALATIGAPSGLPGERFGGIWDVAMAEDGRVAVLDFSEHAVHLYDRNGALLTSLTARGRGEGELGQPTGLSWGAGDDLYIWDPGNARIAQFNASGASLTPVASRRAAAFGDTGFCTLGGRSFLSTYSEARVLHEVGTDGAIVRSFSPPPEIPGLEGVSGVARELALEELTPARLLCDPSGGQVLEMSFFQGRVQLHSAAGELLWSRALADFHPVELVNPEEMGLAYRFSEGTGSHLARSVIPWGEGRILLQYEIRSGEAGVLTALESRLLDLSTGEELDRTRDLPLFLAASGNRLVSVGTLPFPQITIYERH